LVRTFTASDACGNSTTATRTVTVRDTTPPALLGVPPDLTVECDAVPPLAAVGAADSCDPAPVVTASEQRVDGSCPGTYRLLRTFVATDRCGNTSSATQTI